MDLFRKLVEKHLALEQHRLKMDLDLMGIKGVDKQPNVEASDQQLCFKGRMHQFVNLFEVMTCDSCGLETNPVFVPGYNCWDTAIPRGQDKTSISYRYENFCRTRNITDFVLSGRDKFEIIKNIEEVYNAEEPKGSRLPNLNILTYQICKHLTVNI